MKLLQLLLITIISYTSAYQSWPPNFGPNEQGIYHGYPQYQYGYPNGNYGYNGYYYPHPLQPPLFAPQGPQGYTSVVNPIHRSVYAKIGDRYYLLQHQKKKTWFAAALYCREKGLDLATIQNEEEMLAFSKYLIAQGYKGNDYFWISGNDHVTEGEFKVLSTDLPMQYTKWAKNRPAKSATNENCVDISRYDNEFHMNDRACDQLSRFICEVPLPKMGFF